MNQKALLTVICMLIGILGVALPAHSQPVMRNGVEMIDLGEPPLTPPEMNAVMNWIAIQVGAIELPYCYRQSYGNGAGEPYTCKPGLERIGLLCYPPCKPGYHHSTANLCTVDSCPPGFTDIGAFCQKPGPYGRGAGYAAWDAGKCASENPQGCE